MKKLMTIIALGASVITAPAFAATTARAPDEGWTRTQGYAQIHRAHSSIPRDDVYVHGVYQGSDPDPNVRAMLRMDPPNPF
jgi:hypothetical protein